jgi:hypothetical protein
LERLVYQNPAFAVKELDVQTDGTIPVEQLRRWTGVHLGDNLLALDLTRVKRDLEMVASIQKASVERILPNTLRVRVAEREALAQISVPKPRVTGGAEIALFLIDGNGYLMGPPDHLPTVAGQATPESYPTIAGINPNEIQAGRRIDNPQVRAALDLIVAFEESQMAGWASLKQIDLSHPGVLVVTTGQGGEITFNPRNLETQLRRWRDIFDTAQRASRSIATLDLAITNNIPATLLEASAPQAAVPKTSKALRTRKRHV